MDPLVMQDRFVFNNSSELNASRPLPTLDALPEPYQSLLTVLYVITAVVALIENLIALIVLLNGNYGSKQLSTYLANLAFADILVAIFSIPFTYVDLMFGQWIFPLFFCPIVHFVQTISAIVSIYTLIAIGIGRYFAIVTVLDSLRMNLKSHIKLIIVSIWLFGMLLASPLLFVARALPFQYGNDTLYDCREEWNLKLNAKIYTGIVFALTFIVPFTALSFLYGLIGITIVRHRIPGNENNDKNEAQCHTRIKIIKMLLLLVITFAICWLPLQILNLLLWFFDSLRTVDNQFHHNVYFAIYFSCHWLSCAYTFINPFIYCFMSNNFKFRDLIKIMTCTKSRMLRREQFLKSTRYSNSVINTLTAKRNNGVVKESSYVEESL